MRRYHAVPALFLAAVLLFSGCGAVQEPGPAQSGAEPAPAVTETEELVSAMTLSSEPLPGGMSELGSMYAAADSVCLAGLTESGSPRLGMLDGTGEYTALELPADVTEVSAVFLSDGGVRALAATGDGLCLLAYGPDGSGPERTPLSGELLAELSGSLEYCELDGVGYIRSSACVAVLARPLMLLFIEPEETYEIITPKTLLIVVDTYQKRLLESQKIYEKCQRVVVIDHHRMAVGHIDNPLLLYHEPYASSASELVCELLQFLPKEGNVTPLEAQALLAGIMLDTRSFALHVGVRTFEAAAWLRSRGAQTADTKLLFNTSKEEYEARAHIVEGAYIYKGCAIALSGELDAGMNVVLPMAANDLLTINGVDASFVAVAKNGGVNISARSMGALNVQVILEPLGGGGHLMMAGAQLQDCTLPEAERRIREQIDLYRASQAANAAGSR